jgi:Zn-dependent protease
LFLLEPARTQFDLKWRMFGTDIRVHPMFWLVSALLGPSPRGREGLLILLVWVVCVFFSILLHEFGHVLMGRLFGSRGHIVLYSFGGLAIGSSDLSRRWQRIAVSFAGPGIQLAFWGLLKLLILSQPDLVRQIANSDLAFEALYFLIVINLYWALLNLLPVWPLDGGRISREVFGIFTPGRAVAASLWLSILTAGFIAVNSLLAYNDRPHVPYLPDGLYTAIFFALMAVTNYQELQLSRPQYAAPEDSRAPWEQNPDYWKR